MRIRLIPVFLSFGVVLLSACSPGGGGTIASPGTTPADTYFALAVTDNSHNHAGARLLFLDFQDAPDASAIRNNVVISPKVGSGAIALDGAAGDWNPAHLTTVRGLPQNNYPLSEFIDAVAVDITVGSAWDENYVYFLVQWEDAGHAPSTKLLKWIYGNQGGGESGWNPMVNRGVTGGAPNAAAANAAHLLAGGEDEDRVLMMFPVSDGENHFAAGGLGCAAYCHANLRSDNPYQNYTGTGVAVMHTNVSGDRADIWHWKATRTAPSAYADDQHINYATGTTDGRASDSGGAVYLGNPLLNGNPTYRHSSGLGYSGDALMAADAVAFSGTPVAGNTIPAVIADIPNGSRADVEARHGYNSLTHRWTVEFRRRRVTGQGDDRQFAAGGSDAAAPATAAVAATNVAQGQTLYAGNCQSCHGANGAGTLTGNAWAAPRIQRASGSLILKALRTVTPMQSLAAGLSEQNVEDIAAYLQTQATFNATRVLAVTVSGLGVGVTGAVTSNPAGISCPGTCTFNFVNGVTASLTAGYVAGYRFTGWGGACAGTGACDVVLDSDRAVTATYAASAVNYSLDVSVTGSGSVTSNPPGISCGADCSELYTESASVMLTATPAIGYQFSGWSGACSGAGACTVAMNAAATVGATFTAITTPTCANGGVLYDTNGTNGFGRQYAVNSNQVSVPTDIAFIPGSATAFVVIDQSGYANYFNGGCDRVNRVDLRTTLGVVSGGEQGLLNIEFHPDYAVNGYVFFYHTTVASTVNSVTRMSVAFDAGGNLVLSNPQRIIDFRKADAAAASNHNGGGLVFAPDQTLLASIGDGGSDSNTAQADGRLLGKVIRIQPSLAANAGGYTIPSGNMFAASNPPCSNVTLSATACPEILAKGLRNPFRMARDGNIIYLGDVGSGTEEVNSFAVTNNTANFGWPTHDGWVASSTLPGYRNPIVYYTRSGATANAFRAEDPTAPAATGSASVMIGDVYRGSRYDAAMNGGALLFGEFYDGFVRAVGVDASGNITDGDGVPGFHLVHEDGISSMVQGPDGYVYLTALYGPAAVYRLVRP